MKRKNRFLLGILVVIFLSGNMMLFASGTEEVNEKMSEPVTLTWTFWVPEPTEVITAFNDSHPNINVQYEMLSSDQYVNIINTRILSDEAPDIFAPRFMDIYESLVKQDKLVDLSDMPYIGNYDAEAIRQCTSSNGNIYGIPRSAVGWLGFYNKEIFAKYNLELPLYWEDYLEVCETLKANGVVPQIQGAKDLWQGRHILDPNLVAVSRDPLFDNKLATGEAKFTDPDPLEGFQRFEDFIKKGYLHEGSLSLSFIQAWQLFCEGEAAIMQGGTWYSAQAFTQFKPSFEYGCIIFPIATRGETPVVPYSSNAEMQVVYKEGDHVEEALIFLEYLSQPEALELYARTTKTMSAGVGIKADFSEEAILMQEFLDNVGKFQRTKQPSQITNDLRKAQQDIIFGNKTAEEAAEAVQKKLDASL
jgi:raffinose/stachyose/melibiose transport system substrate-binding protein